MKKLRTKYPVYVSLALTLLFPLSQLLGSVPTLIWPELMDNVYLVQLLAELVTLAVMALLTVPLGMVFVFRRSVKPLSERLLLCLPLAAVYLFALLETLILELDTPLAPPVRILWYVLCMMAVGVTEELTFRGLITRMIFAKYGRTTAGLWLSVLTSSLLFAMVHLINAVTADLGGVLIQMVGAAALGICLSAIYLRTGSLWTVALLHAFMDFCAMASSGLFGLGDMTDLVGGYSAASLVSALVYTALGLFLLRPGKIKELTDAEAQPPQSHVIALMAVTALLAGLLSAVAVLSL